MALDITRLGADDQATLAAILAKAQTGVESPVVAAKPKKRSKAETVKYLTEEQVNRFFAQIKSPRDTGDLSGDLSPRLAGVGARPHSGV
jgi:hypothetical protein